MTTTELYQLFLQNPVITTDTRKCTEGSLFFGIKGANFNGNQFAKDAIAQGCAYAFVEEEQYAENKRIFFVNNSIEAIQELAKLHRTTLGTRIVGVTGTNGKTTTKELIASVLKQKYNILYTQGNLNNHIGVPMTLLQLNKQHDIAIIEMGANHPGEIKTLVNIARPNYGVITNVGQAHIEGFGSFEGVINTKCELYDFLKENNGKAFVNQNNEILLAKANEKGLCTIPYGKGSDVDAEIISSDPFLAIRWKNHTIQSQLIGRYNFENILAAIAIGCEMGVEEELIVKALEAYTPNNNRSQFKKTEKNQLIIDAYNANPTSMNASLDNFLQIKADHKTVILGDMKELGHVSETEHQKVADKLSLSNIENILLVGANFAKTSCPKALHFANVEELNQHLQSHLLQGQLILVKGSNSMKLMDCVNLL